MKIAVVGLGYVGLSISVLLAQHNEVVANDLMAEKVDMVNKKISPIVDADIEYYLQNKVWICEQQWIRKKLIKEPIM